MLKNIITFFSLLPLITLCACIRSESYHGYSFPPDYENAIQVNKTSAEKVVAILGSPTTTSSFGGTSYYYINQKQTRVAFLTPQIVEQKVLRLTFDKDNLLSEIKHYSLADRHDIDFAGNNTTLKGSEIGAVEQILSNLGKFNKNRKPVL